MTPDTMNFDAYLLSKWRSPVVKGDVVVAYKQPRLTKEEREPLINNLEKIKKIDFLRMDKFK